VTMPSLIFQVAGVIVGLLIFIAYFANPVKLTRGIVVSVGAAVAAAVLLTALRNVMSWSMTRNV
jgi:hypothetical protein